MILPQVHQRLQLAFSKAPQAIRPGAPKFGGAISEASLPRPGSERNGPATGPSKRKLTSKVDQILTLNERTLEVDKIELAVTLLVRLTLLEDRDHCCFHIFDDALRDQCTGFLIPQVTVQRGHSPKFSASTSSGHSGKEAVRHAVQAGHLHHKCSRDSSSPASQQGHVAAMRKFNSNKLREEAVHTLNCTKNSLIPSACHRVLQCPGSSLINTSRQPNVNQMRNRITCVSLHIRPCL